MALSSFADGSLFGTRFGTAPPRVVALHGWGRSHQDFASSLEGLDAVSVDLPGFGVSPAPSEVGGASMYANLVAPILDICDTPVILVGHSYAGMVIAGVAEKATDRIACLVYLDAFVPDDGKSLADYQPPEVWRFIWQNNGQLPSEE